jgi:2,3-bisphosphoglycerate-dependent phosphoglycerate mutase
MIPYLFRKIFRLMRIFYSFLALIMLTACSSTTTIYLVRHAEKQPQNSNGGMQSNDVALSDSGLARAQVLRDSLAGKKITAVYATTYKRTQQTVEPTAQSKGLTVKQYTASQPASDALVDSLVAVKGKTFLVSGHSNTVPAMVRHLGLPCSFTGNIPDNDYDNLFIITVKKGVRTVKQTTYGAPSP